MKYDPDIHCRRSLRLRGYDYSRAGYYSVTICTQQHECLFGEISEGKLTLNSAGIMIKEMYLELVNKFPSLRCDAFVCMPNYVHFILANNVGADLCVRPGAGQMLSERTRRSAPTPASLGAIIQWFKTMTTNHYIQGVTRCGWKPFQGRLWQRNYWERVIRNERELTALREYIRNNPLQWELDALYGR